MYYGKCKAWFSYGIHDERHSTWAIFERLAYREDQSYQRRIASEVVKETLGKRLDHIAHV